MAKGSGSIRKVSYMKIYKEQSLQHKASKKISLILKDQENGTHKITSPFAIGCLDQEIKEHAIMNNIEYNSSFIYMAPDSIMHARRFNKPERIKVSKDALINFPYKYHSMTKYFDPIKKNYIYSDGENKFVIDTNKTIKISRNRTKKVCFVTASKITNPSDLNGFIKIK